MGSMASATGSDSPSAVPEEDGTTGLIALHAANMALEIAPRENEDEAATTGVFRKSAFADGGGCDACNAASALRQETVTVGTSGVPGAWQATL